MKTIARTWKGPSVWVCEIPHLSFTGYGNSREDAVEDVKAKIKKWVEETQQKGLLKEFEFMEVDL